MPVYIYICSDFELRNSYDSDDLIRGDSAQFDVDTIEFQRKREVMNKRLDDYLDSVLLSAICAKVGGKREEADQR